LISNVKLPKNVIKPILRLLLNLSAKGASTRVIKEFLVNTARHAISSDKK
jgi:hypothetical protein